MKSDANSFHQSHGADRLRDYIDLHAEGYVQTGSSSTPSPSRKSFKPIWLADIAVDDDPACLVDGILPAGPSFGVTYGPPKSLKSFLLMHMGYHIAASRPCFGRDVQGGAVIYVTSEGVVGVKRRFAAIRKHYGAEGDFIAIGLVSVMPNLGTGPDDREQLKAAIKAEVERLGIPVRMIVIDTLRRAIAGKSENDQKDVSIFVDNCEDIARTFVCHVNAVHHSPRSDETRSSGSNSLDGAADVMISVVRAESGVATAEVVRFKDGREGSKIEFDLSPVEVGTDRNGKPLMSCVANILREPSDDEVNSSLAKEKVPLSAAQRRLFDILCKSIGEGGSNEHGDPHVPSHQKAVSREMAKRYAKTEGWWNEASSDKSANSNFNNKLNELAGKRAIGLSAKSIWKP